MPLTLATLGVLTLSATAAAALFWPAADPTVVEHTHADLAPDHPHMLGARPHFQAFDIDDLHRRCPVVSPS